MALWTDTTPPKNDDSKLASLLGASDDPLSYAKYGAWQIGFRNYLIRRGLAVCTRASGPGHDDPLLPD